MRRFVVSVVSLSALALLPILCQKPAMAEGELLIYGGRNNRVFLGCISCNQNNPNSIFNEYGLYGSEYSATSIFNKYSIYGAEISLDSVCSPYAQNPPIVVDEDGNFYGALTVNKFHKNVTRNANLRKLITLICN